MNTEYKALERFINFVLLGSEENSDPKAAFRCGLYKSNKTQDLWKEYLMKHNSSILITIKLPEYRSYYKTTRNYYESLNQYREIVRELEKEFTESKNHWIDKPLPFIGSFQKTKSGTWVFYLLIQLDKLNKHSIYKLCLSIQKIIEKHNFEENVIDIRPIDNQDGISMFVLKTQTYNEDLTHDEGNTIFTLETLFKVKEKPDKFLAFLHNSDQNWSKSFRMVVSEYIKDEKSNSTEIL